MATFNKTERLCSKKEIDSLFTSKLQKVQAPLKIIWNKLPMASTYPAQVIIVVPKRLFKKAVHRNRIKRQIRECYRLQKDSFYEHLLKEGIGVNLALIYFAPEFYKTHEIMHSLQTLLQKVK